MGGGGGSKGEVTYSCVGGEGGGYIIYLWGGSRGEVTFCGEGGQGCFVGGGGGDQGGG